MKTYGPAALVAIVLTTTFVAVPSYAQASNGQIAFARASSPEDQDIFVMNPDGTFATNLTSTPTRSEFDPAYSRDGARMAFSAYESFSADVYSMASDGSDKRRLTTTPEFEGAPQFSPDGGKIAYLRDGGESARNVWLMNADGSAQEALTTSGRVEFSGISWRPDGGAVLFSQQTGGTRSDYDIFEIDLASRAVRQVLARPGFDADPRYSPDGTRIAFIGEGADGTSLDAFVVNSDGSGAASLSQEGYHYALDWAPDGSTIVMGRARGRAQEIATVSPGGAVTLVTYEIATDIAWQACTVASCRLETTTPAEVTVASAFQTRRGLKVIVVVTPAHAGQTVEVTLYRRRDGKFRRVETIAAKILRNTVAEPIFKVRPRGACRAVAVFSGDDDHGGDTGARRFPCSGQVAG